MALASAPVVETAVWRTATDVWPPGNIARKFLFTLIPHRLKAVTLDMNSVTGRFWGGRRGTKMKSLRLGLIALSATMSVGRRAGRGHSAAHRACLCCAGRSPL